MKICTSICSSLLIAAVGTFCAAGQPSRTDINPALLYYQAFLVAPEPLSEADDAYLYSKEGRSQPLPERFGALFEGYDNQFKLVRQAAQATVPCDWGLDWSAGPSTLLPHLARAKAVAQASRFRVVWELQHDRQADARDDLLASFALARNVTRNGPLISVLVQNAIEAINCSTVAENFGRFSPETLQELEAGLERLPARTTVAQSDMGERVLCQDWLLHKIADLQKANPGNDAKVMAALSQLLSSPGNPDQSEEDPWAQLSRAAGGTSDGVAKLVRDAESFVQKMPDILAVPYGEFESRMAQVKAEAAQTANPLISNFVPSLEPARLREFRVLACLAQVRAAVEYKLHGEPGLQSVADPCGQGPFGFRRFVLEGVDRGFELKSAHDIGRSKGVLIFVETAGPAFRVNGPYAGQAITNSASQR